MAIAKDLHNKRNMVLFVFGCVSFKANLYIHEVGKFILMVK